MGKTNIPPAKELDSMKKSIEKRLYLAKYGIYGMSSRRPEIKKG